MFATISSYLRLLLLLIVAIWPTLLWAQNDTIKTDSSIIEVKYSRYGNSISSFNTLKTRDKCYFTEYYLDTKKLKEEGVFIGNDAVGVWKKFGPDGALVRAIDYNNNDIVYYDKDVYPFFDYQKAVKIKGDSIVKSYYGAAFFEHNVTWDIDVSAIYSDTDSGDWTDSLPTKPTQFLLCYSVKLGDQSFPEMIEFEIDSSGNFVKGEDIKGLERLPANSPALIRLTLHKAISIAKTKGLVETETTKAKAFLAWEKSATEDPLHGHIRLFVIVKTLSIQHLNPKGRSTVIDKYDEYVFNPWTAKYVEKRKMKTIRGWEKFSGSSSGLLPDK